MNFTTEDKDCWNLVRKSSKKVILIANKSELKSSRNYEYQLNEFGIEDLVKVTALSKGTKDIIYSVIKNKIPKKFL